MEAFPTPILSENRKRAFVFPIPTMPPDTFERYLPFAIALGIETQWAKAFSGISQNPPSWYVATTPYTTFSHVQFLNSIQSMTLTAQQTFLSAPRSQSGSSGFGGHGFSGGGFGGGGGRAF